MKATGERWERRRWREERPERVAAVCVQRRRSRQGAHRAPQQELSEEWTIWGVL